MVKCYTCILLNTISLGTIFHCPGQGQQFVIPIDEQTTIVMVFTIVNIIKTYNAAAIVMKTLILIFFQN